MKRLIAICLLLVAVLSASEVRAQHTLGVTGGGGFALGRFFPAEETRMIWGNYTAGLSWRFYGPQRFAGGFGVDLEFLQRGFSFAPNADFVEGKKDYLWYTRRVNSVVLPIVWQPHVYIKHRVRIFADLSVFFSYNISSTYVDEYLGGRGDYNFKLSRDNRWGYGLAGGGGIAVLVGRVELSARARYYFGYSDLLRNGNKYPKSANEIDGPENPFDSTPQRSPIDNLTFTVGVGFRFNKGGFTEWENRPLKRERKKERFDYK